MNYSINSFTELSNAFHRFGDVMKLWRHDAAPGGGRGACAARGDVIRARTFGRRTVRRGTVRRKKKF